MGFFCLLLKKLGQKEEKYMEKCDQDRNNLKKLYL